MEQATGHPEYSATLELIASLPPRGLANERDLICDMGLGSNDLTPLIADAKRTHGILIIRENSGGGRSLRFGISTVRAAMQIGADYMRRVYGGHDHPAGASR